MSIVTPHLVSFDYDDFSCKDTSLSIVSLLRQVKEQHTIANLEYNFSDKSLPVYKAFYRDIKNEIDSKDIFDEADQRAILNKMLGQSARICLVMQAITNAATKQVAMMITEETVRRSIVLSRYILAHKLALITNKAESQNTPTVILTKDDLLNDKRKIAKVLTQESVTAREVAQKRRCPGTNSKSTVAARELIASLANQGFGDVQNGPNNSVSLKRRKYAEMAEGTRELLEELEVDVDIYRKHTEDN